MATRWAIATGLWSATSTWDGGTLPTSADDVYADGKTVTIDQNITALSLRTTARSGGTAGGGFALTNGVTVACTGTGIVPGTTACVTFALASPSTATVNSIVLGSSTTSFVGGIAHTGTGTLNVNGNLTVGSASGNVCIAGPSGGGTLNVVGNVTTAGGGTSATGISTSNGTTNLTGDLTGNGANNSVGISCSGSAVVAVTGTVTGNLNGGQGIVHGGTSGSVTVTGLVRGGTGTSGAPGPGITTNSNFPIAVTVTGSVESAPYSGSAGIVNSGTNSGKIITIIGTVTAISGQAVLDSGGAGWIAIGGSTIDSVTGTVAIQAPRVRVIPTTNTYRQYTNSTGYPNGTPVTYGSLDYIPNNVPVPSNVRYGTVYGNNQYTGTLRVPPANSVASGVPVDNTTGTAALSPADVAALIGAQVAAAVSSPPVV